MSGTLKFVRHLQTDRSHYQCRFNAIQHAIIQLIEYITIKMGYEHLGDTAEELRGSFSLIKDSDSYLRFHIELSTLIATCVFAGFSTRQIQPLQEVKKQLQIVDLDSNNKEVILQRVTRFIYELRRYSGSSAQDFLMLSRAPNGLHLLRSYNQQWSPLPAQLNVFANWGIHGHEGRLPIATLTISGHAQLCVIGYLLSMPLTKHTSDNRVVIYAYAPQLDK